MPSKPPNALRKHALLARTAVNRLADQRRGSARERGYDTWWEKASAAYLREHPLCRYCATSGQGRVTPATLVDHLYPHKGDMDLFRDATWWVSSCTPCHSGFKQRVEHVGLDAIDRLADRLGLPRRPRDPA